MKKIINDINKALGKSYDGFYFNPYIDEISAFKRTSTSFCDVAISMKDFDKAIRDLHNKNEIYEYINTDYGTSEVSERYNLNDYKQDFEDFIIYQGKQIGEDWSQYAIDECSAWIESRGYESLNWECPEDDAEEAMSYWQ